MPAFEAKDWNDWWSNGFLGRLLGNVAGRYLGTNLTDAEREANEFSRQMAREANDFTHQENQLAMQFSADQAMQQMAFQERMANSQYQRGVADMQAAGINPAIAYSQGGAVAPSGAAGSASSGAGAVVSSVSPHAGSLSDIFRLFSLRKELALLDAQAEQAKSVAVRNRAEAANLEKHTSWIDRMNTADLGIKEETIRKYGVEIDSILQSTEGQRLYNEWMPKLWEQQFRKGEVDIQATIVGISKTMEEIQELKARSALEWSEKKYHDVLQGLATAQISLVKQQEKHEFAQTGEATARTRKVSAEAWEAEWKSDFRKEHGVEPDSGLWQTLIQVIGDVNHGADHSAPKVYAGR